MGSGDARAKNNDLSLQGVTVCNECAQQYLFTSVRAMENWPQSLAVPLYLRGRLGVQLKDSVPCLRSSLGSLGTQGLLNG